MSLQNKNFCAVNSNPIHATVSRTSDDIATEYADLFEGFGLVEGNVHLQVDDFVLPVRMPLRKLPVAIKEKVRVELERLQSQGIIVAVAEPTAWISTLLVVTKPNGGIRIYIEPKPLNKALMCDHYPTPTLDDFLPCLSNSMVFSTVDIANSFWHLQLDEESGKLTTFEMPFGKFRWLFLPYGVSAASELLQGRMHETLRFARRRLHRRRHPCLRLR